MVDGWKIQQLRAGNFSRSKKNEETTHLKPQGVLNMIYLGGEASKIDFKF